MCAARPVLGDSAFAESSVASGFTKRLHALLEDRHAERSAVFQPGCTLLVMWGVEKGPRETMQCSPRLGSQSTVDVYIYPSEEM